MFSKFLSLEKEKQDRIINAAIKEFAQKGYEHASTNEIVKEAEISKGLLFHYFTNKKQLFLFLYDYGMNLIRNEILEKIDFNETDFFARIRQVSLVKIDVLHKYPALLKFLEKAYVEDSPKVKAELEEKNRNSIEINMGKIYQGIDLSKFKDGLNLEKVIKIITWTFEKMGEEYMYKARLSETQEIDYDRAYEEANDYFEIFIKCFYK